jgi:hypothetical protein
MSENLELLKFEAEKNRSERELALKENEFALRQEEVRAKIKSEGRTGFSFTPLAATILGGTLAAVGTFVGAYIQGLNNMKLERQKFESNLVLKAVETGDRDKAKVNLLFLVDAGFLADSKENIKKLQKEDVPVLPPSNQAASSEQSSDARTAGEWEREGFNQVLNKDVDAAIEAFSQSEKLQPKYHNVSEIRKLLEADRVMLDDAAKKGDTTPWLRLYAELLVKYSWRMPKDIVALLAAKRSEH